MLTPIFPSDLHRLEWLVLTVEEGAWEVGDVLAVFEFSSCYLGGFFEVAVFVKQFMHFVFDFGLEIQLLQKARNLLLDVRGSAPALDNLVFNGLLDGPECIAIFNIFEYEFAFFAVRQIHIGFAALWLGWLNEHICTFLLILI